MKKLITNLILFFSLSLSLEAQSVKLDKYPMIPDELSYAFCDYVAPFASGIANGRHGQYYGQITPSKDMYGFGQYQMNDDVVITGQFRMNSFVFGIKMGSHIVRVGSSEHYISYDLTSGEPISITKRGEVIPVSDEARKIYRFQSLSYASGDRYVGETVNGKRDGYGIYMYKTGEFYYGSYKNNDRYGAGALFLTDNHIRIQHF
ncbi:MAG: hypothetical protein K6E54_08115 [Bacteroidaceae bacterium]|nr:hypothetical protein [Bacteroidaceae bacterium]